MQMLRQPQNQLGFEREKYTSSQQCFLLIKKGLSPAFPVTGMDNILGLQADNTTGVYPDAGDIDGFGSNYLINGKGLLERL
jgi:hypothetical protein